MIFCTCKDEQPLRNGNKEMERIEQIKEAFKHAVKRWGKKSGKSITEEEKRAWQDAFVFGALWADAHRDWIEVEHELPTDGTLVIAVNANEVEKYGESAMIMGTYFDSVMPDDEEEQKYYGPIEQSVFTDTGCENIYNFTHFMYLNLPEASNEAD